MSAASQKQEWLVVVPDHEGKLEKRMEVRPKHFEELSAKFEADAPCSYKVGGALLNEPIREGESPKMKGSFLLAVADTEEEVVKTLKDDIYTKSGVWDWEKVRIYPIKSAFIKP